MSSPGRLPRIFRKLRPVWLGLNFILLALGLAWIFLAVQDRLWWNDVEVLQELPSPDGAATAYLIRWQAGEQSPRFHAVRVGATGWSVRSAQAVVQGEDMANLAVGWETPRRLRVRVPCGRFTNAGNYFRNIGDRIGIAVAFSFDPCPAASPPHEGG